MMSYSVLYNKTVRDFRAVKAPCPIVLSESVGVILSKLPSAARAPLNRAWMAVSDTDKGKPTERERRLAMGLIQLFLP